MSIPESDPTEQAGISGADFAMMCDEIDTLRLTLGALEADYSKLMIERDAAVEKLSAIRKAARYVEDGSSETCRIFQDDATRLWYFRSGEIDLCAESFDGVLVNLVKEVSHE